MRKFITIYSVILLLAWLISPVTSFAAITFDATSTSGATSSATVRFTHTASSSCSAGCLLNINIGANATVVTTSTSVQANSGGVTTTLTRAVSLSSSTWHGTVEQWYMTSTATGAIKITVTFPNAGGGTDGYVVGASTWLGVNMATPLNTTSSAQGNNSPASKTIVAASSSLIIDNLNLDANNTATQGTGQTVLHKTAQPSFGDFSAASYKIVNAAVTTSTSWTFATTNFVLAQADFNVASSSQASTSTGPNPVITVATWDW